MPSSNASDLSVTSVGLLWKEFGSPPFSDPSESMSSGDSDDIGVVPSVENSIASDVLFEETHGEIHFLGHVASVHLDFIDLGFLLAEVDEFGLSMGNQPDNGAVLLDSLELSLDGLVGVLSWVLGEGLSLGSVPVLVKSSLEIISQRVGPDSLKGSEASWGFNIADKSSSFHGRHLHDRRGFDELTLVELRGLSPDFSEDVSHPGLVSDESSQMAWLFGVVLGEGSDSALKVAGSLSGKETQTTVTGLLVFSVTHWFWIWLQILKD